MGFIMQYISLKNNSLSTFIAKGELSELSGSSSMQVVDGLLFAIEKRQKNKIENKTAIQEYLNCVIGDNMTVEAYNRLWFLRCCAWSNCMAVKWSSEVLNDRFEYYDNICSLFQKTDIDIPFKYAKVCADIAQSNSRYQTQRIIKKDDRQINKSKVRGKMFALFNLKRSRRFIAFYSVSFPLGCSDDSAFEIWNYWLTACRKRFGLEHYIWVTERQKNNTIHFHMLTNNWLPVQQVNRAMAIIINNAVARGLLSWGNSSLDRYNGVDVDAVYNSKRHKKTGKNLSQAQQRDWISKYITKYVTKNEAKFKHLCWHCSRSLSALFTSTIVKLSESFQIVEALPDLYTDGNSIQLMDDKLYYQINSDFVKVLVFKFVPPDWLFDKVRAFNDLIFEEYVVQHKIQFNSITFKTTSL